MSWLREPLEAGVDTMTWHRRRSVPTPDQLQRRDREIEAERCPGDSRLRGASRRHLERADAAVQDLFQTHLGEYR